MWSLINIFIGEFFLNFLSGEASVILVLFVPFFFSSLFWIYLFHYFRFFFIILVLFLPLFWIFLFRYFGSFPSVILVLLFRHFGSLSSVILFRHFGSVILVLSFRCFCYFSRYFVQDALYSSREVSDWEKQNNTNHTYICPRDWCLSASWGPIQRP